MLDKIKEVSIHTKTAALTGLDHVWASAKPIRISKNIPLTVGFRHDMEVLYMNK
jgi:hypothetical protein